MKLARPALLLAMTLMGCASLRTASQSSTSIGAQPGNAHTGVHSLSRDTAAMRASMIHRVSYTLWFGLDQEHDDFQGRTVIRFELRDQATRVSQVLPIDLNGAIIRSLTINGQTMSEKSISSRYDGRTLTLRTSELASGQNRIEIAYSRKYSTTGSGLHRYQDAEDKSTYLFTDLEPFEANKVFPCFDQPDLKASYELTVEAPEPWVVVANTMEREVTTVDGRKSWQFPPSPTFSTYVFALHAGPFKSWKSDANGIPLRLFARRSLAKYGDREAREWFEVTRQGLEFFATEFGYPYPFAKYDQLLLPEFNSEAMENVAAATFTEDYLYRSRVTEDTRRGRAETILHEIAHMWFGNLVTMRWWNGLWLNESFATFAATRALAEATRFGEFGRKPQPVWQAFFTANKLWAYWEDQLVTTHPVDVSVRDTSQAFANFDGITYGKGGAALKQLRFALGDDDFKEGLQRYFLRHAYRNTTLTDFMRSLAEAAGHDLGDWQRTWLQTSGVNTVEPQWTCGPPTESMRRAKGPVILDFKLLQRGSANNNMLRPHRTKVALLGPDFTPIEVLIARYSGAEAVVDEAIGKPCPAAVFPNWGDEDYVKTALDPGTLSLVKKNLGRVPDPFARQMLWHALWESVIDGRLAAGEYARIALAHVGVEKNTQVLKRALGTLTRADGGASALKFVPDGARESLGREIESAIRKRLRLAEAGSDAQLIWFEAWLQTPLPVESQRQLLAWLDGKGIPQGLTIDQDQRWAMIRALARHGHGDARARIASELEKDATEAGNRSAIAAEAALPDPSVKATWWARIISSRAATTATDASAPPEYNDSQLRDAMEHLFPLGQEALAREYSGAFFKALPDLIASKEETFLSTYTDTLFPALCDPSLTSLVTQTIDSLPSLSASAVKNLRIGLQEDERCIRARALTASALP